MDDTTLHSDIFLKIALRDDHEAFRKLFFEFYPSLCVFAGRYVSPPEICEDLVQDLFFTIWKKRKTLNIHSSFRNFLITSLRNSCIDYLRKQSSHEKYIDKNSLVTSSPSPYDIYTINELEEMLQVALEKLPPNVQAAFTMSRTSKMTYNEIAAEMNVSRKTVESYISRALKILREDLKDYLPIALLLPFIV